MTHPSGRLINQKDLSNSMKAQDQDQLIWKKSSYSILLLIFLCAFLVRLVAIFSFPSPIVAADAVEYSEIAQSIAEGKGYALKDGTPTALRPPLYPVFLAGIYYLLGTNVRIVQVAHAFLLALACIILYSLGKNIFDLKTAYLASCIAAAYPLLIYPAYELMSESLLIALFSITVLFVLKSREQHYNAILAGVSLALSVLTKPTVLFALPYFVIWIFKNSLFSKRLARISMFLIAFSIPFIPWTVRNYDVFQSFVPISNNGGIALFDSHILPDRGLGFSATNKFPQEYRSITDEYARNRFLINHTLTYIVDHPGKVLKQTALKAAMFFYPLDGYWYPFSLGSRYNVFWGSVFLFSLGGLSFTKWKSPGVHLLLWTMLSFFVTIVVFQGIPRYRLPLEVIFILFAASGINYLYYTRRVWLTGILAFNILIWLLFRYVDLQHMFSWERITHLL